MGRRFFLTYVLFFVCLVVLFVPMYRMISSLFSRSYMDTAMHLLETGLLNLETELETVTAIVQDDFVNPDIINIRYLEKPFTTPEYYRTIKATTEFTRSVLRMRLIRDCGIVLPNGIIITPNRIHFESGEFYGSYFRIEQASDFGEWKRILLDNANVSKLTALQTVHPHGNGAYEALTYVMKMPYASPAPNSFFFATIGRDYLLSYLTTGEMIENGVLRLSDLNGNVLFAYGRSADASLSFIEKESGRLGIRASVGISRGFFARKLKPLQDLAVLFSALYVLAGIALSVVFAYRSSRPMRNIMSFAARIGGDRLHAPAPERGGGDYDYLMDFLRQTDSTLENYEQDLRRQKELLRSNLFERLIRGLAYSSSTFERARFYFPEFPASYRMAALMLSGPGNMELSANAARQKLFLDIAAPRLPPQAHVHFSGSFLLLLLPVSRPDGGRGEVDGLLAGLRDRLSAKAEFEGGIAVSDVFHGMEDLRLAFSQVNHILRLKGNAPSHGIHGMEDFPMSPLLDQDLREYTRFYELVARAEREKALDMVDAALRRIRESGYLSESAVQEIFYSYRRSLSFIRGALPEGLRSRMVLPEYDPAADMETLFAAVRRCAAEACGCVAAQRNDASEASHRSVLAHIEEHLDSPGLCVKSVTLRFGITENTLQAVVRKRTGKSFFDFVEGRRMEKAERLLCGTTMPITELITQCGYATLNSFYKAFRRNFGVSPSAMRQGPPKGPGPLTP